MGEMGLDGVTVQREPGGDLLSRVLRRSTLGAGGFHGRVRDGIGWVHRRYGRQAAAARLVLQGDWVLRVALAVGAIEHCRVISTGWLRTLLPDHRRPIDVVVYDDSRGVLVLRRVSRLDAFSGYPVRT